MIVRLAHTPFQENQTCCLSNQVLSYMAVPHPQATVERIRGGHLTQDPIILWLAGYSEPTVKMEQGPLLSVQCQLPLSSMKTQETEKS